MDPETIDWSGMSKQFIQAGPMGLFLLLRFLGLDWERLIDSIGFWRLDFKTGISNTRGGHEKAKSGSKCWAGFLTIRSFLASNILMPLTLHQGEGLLYVRQFFPNVLDQGTQSSTDLATEYFLSAKTMNILENQFSYIVHHKLLKVLAGILGWLECCPGTPRLQVQSPVPFPLSLYQSINKAK